MAVLGEVIVTKIMEKFVEIGFVYAADRYFAHDTSMEVELERLNDALPQILTVVEMAESGKQEISGPLKKWLWQLKDAVDKADDVLDELDYLELQEKVEKKASCSEEHGHSGRGKVLGFLSDSKRRVVDFGKRVVKSDPDPTLEKLRGAVKSLDKVAASVGNFISTLQYRQLHQHLQSQSTVPTRETGPILNERKVIGREEEKGKLLDWLRKPVAEEDESSTSVSLFSIFGHGGVGKTTLTQLVYNDESLANSFERKIWVCISTPFDVKKLMADMIEYATQRRPEVKSLGALQKALEKAVSSRKFLLVLDDAWNHDNRSEWDKLFAPLRSGHKGSKILLTTRNVWVAEMAASALGGSINEPMKLKPLDYDNFLSLFNRHAFAGLNSCDYGKLESIGKQIAKRLRGLPLAAKTIGALLNYNLDCSHWTIILQSKNISDQAQQSDGVMPFLMLSYHHLPMHLRPCFAYCSIFPQDYRFSKDDLVFMWMGLGFLQQSPQYRNETPEDTGRRWFDDLVKLSFFEQDYGDGYKMHDLLHDLACKVSQDVCFRSVGDMSIDQIPNTVRYLYFETDKLDLLKDVGKRKNLRALVLVFRGYANEHAKDFEEVFKLLETIRVLRLAVDGMNVLPDAIGNLRHIRYLSIRHVISQLPSSFCRLYHLQVLASERFGRQSVLGLNNLISLRHLIPCKVYYEKIDGIGTLTSLQRLSFAANVYKLSELKDLRDLRELKIRGLENRKHHEEVSMIELHDKKDLRMLKLAWSGDVADEYEQMLGRLQPPASLRKLKIKGYQGARSPYWMEPELLKNLVDINLKFSKAWEHLPSLGKLPYLRHLTLMGLSALQQINCEGGFQQLQYLFIYNCKQWEEWSGLEAEAVVPWCPLLQELSIEYCPKLKALPPLPLSLQKLVLIDVGLCDSPTFWAGSNCSGSSCSTSFSSTSSPSLSSLTIRSCENLTSVAGLFRHHLTSLRHLKISYCEELLDWHAEEGIQHLCAIRSMWIVNCPKLKALPPLPLSLQRLVLIDVGLCDSPTCWVGSNCSGSSCFSSTPSPSLSELRIEKCGKLTSVAGLTFLRHLRISDCEELVDWHAEEGFQHLCATECMWIKNCPKLKALPPLPLSLQKFELEDVGLSDSPAFWVGNNCGGSSCRTSFSSTSSPALSLLRIRRCGKLTSVAGLFRQHLTSLRELEISDCEELVDLHVEEGFQHLSDIWRLVIVNCPKLKMAPDAIAPIDCFSLSSLKSLRLVDGGELDSLTPTLLMQSSLTSLSILKLGGANHITPFPSEEACRRFTSLRLVHLVGCRELTSIEHLKAIPHLDRLIIQKCPKLVLAAAAATSASIKWEEEQEFTSTVEVLDIDDPFLLRIEPLRKLTSVRQLTIGDCSHLEAAHAESWLLQNSTSLQHLHLRNIAKLLPSTLQTLSSLESLTLNEAYELQSLPRLPSSLKILCINGCNETLEKRCREKEGADWRNIQHIPRIDIHVQVKDVAIEENYAFSNPNTFCSSESQWKDKSHCPNQG